MKTIDIMKSELARRLEGPAGWSGVAIADYLNTATGEQRQHMLRFIESLQGFEPVKKEDLSDDLGQEINVPDAHAQILRELRRFNPHCTLREATKSRPYISYYPKFDTEEGSAMWAVAELFQSDSLHLIRKCGFCNEWFPATRKDKNFCSSVCEKRHRQDTPERREKNMLRSRANRLTDKIARLKSDIAQLSGKTDKDRKAAMRKKLEEAKEKLEAINQQL